MKIEIKKVRESDMEHYKVYVDGKLYCSCDSMKEVEEELDKLES